MLTQSEKDSPEINYPLIIWTSLLAAGAFIVIVKAGVFFDVESLGQFILISLLNVEFAASVFVYNRAEHRHKTQAIATVFFIPMCVGVIIIPIIFLSELFYGGSGFHGEYLFPFLR